MEQGPGARRRYLGKTLRRLREQAGFKGSEVAGLMHVTQATVSKIEGGRTAIMLRNVAKMLEIYGIDSPQADALMAIAEQANRPGWWESYANTMPDSFEIYASLEADAVQIWTYEAEFVPGLFQTPDYVRAVHRCAHPDSTADQLDRWMRVRLERQQHIRGRQVTAVINEAVVLRLVGGPEVMRDQLQRLIGEIDAGLDLRLLRFDAGVHPAMTGAFSMLRFEGNDQMDLVYTEDERGGNIYERPVDLIRYGDLFTRLCDAAQTATETAQRLTRLMSEL